jgi:hypothetical protein
MYFSDLHRISQDHPPEDQVSPTIDYLLDRGSEEIGGLRYIAS